MAAPGAPGYGPSENGRAREEQAISVQHRLKLSPEEIRVLKECNYESFWFRCVPLGALMIGATTLAVRQGYLKPHPVYGSLFKNFAAGFGAYVLGKLSYQEECQKKILSLENSALADAMRKGRKGINLMQEMALPEITGSQEDAQHSQGGNGNGNQEFKSDISIDTSANVQNKGLDDALRPTMDRHLIPGKQNKSEGAENTFISYDELRRRNRDQYMQKKNDYSRPSIGVYNPPPQEPEENSDHQIPMPPPPQSSGMYSGMSTHTEDKVTTSNTGPKKRIRRNQYGDIIEE